MGIKQWVAGEELTASDLNGRFRDNISLEAGENITAGQPVVIGDDTSTAEQIAQDTTDTGHVLDDDDIDLVSQSFTTSADTDQITAIQQRLSKGGTLGGMNLTVKIYLADGSDEPTGAVLASKQVVLGASQAEAWITFTLATALDVLASTKYVYTVEIDSHTGADNLSIKYESGSSLYAGGLSKHSTDTGSSWASLNYDLTFRVDMLQDITASGKVYLSNATLDNALANNFIGFADETITSGNSGLIKLSGYDDNQTGLTVGSMYYLSDTLGTIADSAGSESRRVGIAISATKILLRPELTV